MEPMTEPIYQQLVAELGDPFYDKPVTVEIPVQSYRKHKKLT